MSSTLCFVCKTGFPIATYIHTSVDFHFCKVINIRLKKWFVIKNHLTGHDFINTRHFLIDLLLMTRSVVESFWLFALLLIFTSFIS